MRGDVSAGSVFIVTSVRCARNLVHVGFVVDRVAAAGVSPSTEHLH